MKYITNNKIISLLITLLICTSLVTSFKLISNNSKNNNKDDKNEISSPNTNELEENDINNINEVSIEEEEDDKEREKENNPKLIKLEKAFAEISLKELNDLSLFPELNDDSKDSHVKRTVPDKKFLKEYQTGINWEDVKTKYAGKKNPKLQLTMKAWLQYRYLDLLTLLKEVINHDSLNINQKKVKIEQTFSGHFQEFFPKQKISVHSLTKKDKNGAPLVITGKLKFFHFGSQTETSDIDLNVDFIPDNKDTDVFDILDVIMKTISIYNDLFNKKHGDNGANSLEYFDVNLYSPNFGIDGIKNIMKEIQKSDDYCLLQDVDRISVLNILIKDNIKVINDYLRKNKEYKQTKVDNGGCNFNSKDKCMNHLVERIKTEGTRRIVDLSSDLANTIFQEYSEIDNIYFHIHRSRKILLRNDKSILELMKAQKFYLESIKETSEEVKLSGLVQSMSHLVGSNYHAMEAYSASGSVYDIMIDQGVLKPAEFSLTQANYEDSFLMNFAYAIEHYYSHFSRKGETSDAIKKFSKYLSRMIKIAFDENKNITYKSQIKSVLFTLVYCKEDNYKNCEYDFKKAIPDIDPKLQSFPSRVDIYEKLDGKRLKKMKNNTGNANSTNSEDTPEKIQENHRKKNNKGKLVFTSGKMQAKDVYKNDMKTELKNEKNHTPKNSFSVSKIIVNLVEVLMKETDELSYFRSKCKNGRKHELKFELSKEANESLKQVINNKYFKFINKYYSKYYYSTTQLTSSY